MTFSIEDLIKVLLAIAAGGLIGLEREFRDKAAGFRTLIFISVGATVFTILSSGLAGEGDPGRIAANIVTGIGFLGAGAILREGLRITGLTTAAAIWLTAALGMAIGGGYYMLAGVVLLATLAVLWVFPYFEFWVDRIREEHTYLVTCPVALAKIEAIEAKLREFKLVIRSSHHVKHDQLMECTWSVTGSPRNHAKFLQYLFEDKDVKAFSY